MAEFVVSFVGERLGDLLIEQATFLHGVKQNVEQIRVELRRMQCFLKDADKRQDEDDSLRNWVSEIREVASDAEDAEDVIGKGIFIFNIGSFKKIINSSLILLGRNHAAVLHELSPQQMPAARNERVETQASQLHRDAFECLEVGASCKDNDDKVGPLISEEFTSENKCLPLFPEEKSSDIFCPVITQPEVAASKASERRKVLQLGGQNNQPKQGSPRFLGLSLTKKPVLAGCAANTSASIHLPS